MVKVTNYGDEWEIIPVIEIGGYPLHMEDEEEAERCAAAINAVLAARDAEVERLREKNRELNKRCQMAESAAANVEKQVRDAEQRGAERQAAASKCVHYAERDAQWERAMAAQYRADYIHSRYEWMAMINDARKLIDTERVQKGDQ
jgi:hypothetical protein